MKRLLIFSTLAIFLVAVESARRKSSTTTTTTRRPSMTQEFDEDRILIGAFNLRKFGLPKIANESVLQTIIEIISRYDVLAISEITDRTELAIQRLMHRLNQVSSLPYNYIVSERVGRTNSKEQYGLIFRSDLVQVKNHFLFNDSANDPFAREPHIAIVRFKGYARDIALVNVHVKPTDAVAEIDALADVQEWIVHKLRIPDVMILGDLNADCSYVPKKMWKTIRLRNNATRFQWLISDEVDTTVGKTNCAYDRIVISGPTIKSFVIASTAKTFTFDTEFGLNESYALQISDHYPVEVAIRSRFGPRKSGSGISNSRIRLDIDIDDGANYSTNITKIDVSGESEDSPQNISLSIEYYDYEMENEGNNSLIIGDRNRTEDNNNPILDNVPKKEEKPKSVWEKFIPEWAKKAMMRWF